MMQKVSKFRQSWLKACSTIEFSWFSIQLRRYVCEYFRNVELRPVFICWKENFSGGDFGRATCYSRCLLFTLSASPTIMRCLLWSYAASALQGVEEYRSSRGRLYSLLQSPGGLGVAGDEQGVRRQVHFPPLDHAVTGVQSLVNMSNRTLFGKCRKVEKSRYRLDQLDLVPGLCIETMDCLSSVTADVLVAFSCAFTGVA